MRDAGIPTSQQPVRARGGAKHGQYEYDVPKPGGGRKTVVVQHHPADKQHPKPHWEAGDAVDRSPTKYGTLRYGNKKKREYRGGQ
jgi:hypothetical protein